MLTLSRPVKVGQDGQWLGKTPTAPENAGSIKKRQIFWWGETTVHGRQGKKKKQRPTTTPRGVLAPKSREEHRRSESIIGIKNVWSHLIQVVRNQTADQVHHKVANRRVKKIEPRRGKGRNLGLFGRPVA